MKTNTKNHKVVMLPTEKASNIYLDGYGKLNLSKVNDILNSHKQHLYIISDDEIKDSDWMYNTHHNIISKGPGGGNHYDKKIVATTDKSLKKYSIRDEKGDIIQQLPQLPESFIQAYIKAYNEGSPITTVDLEMEEDI